MKRVAGTYTLIDNEILRTAPKLEGSAGWVLLTLAARDSYTHSPALTIPEIMAKAGLRERTVERAIKTLQDKHLALCCDGVYMLVGACSAVNYAVTPRHIPRIIRQEVFERDGYVCTYCGCEEDLTLDHLHPWSRGGLHTLENLVVACRTCNSSKNAKTPNEWAVSRVVN